MSWSDCCARRSSSAWTLAAEASARREENEVEIYWVGGWEEDNLRAQEADIAAMRTCQAPRPLFPSFTMMADGRSDR